MSIQLVLIPQALDGTYSSVSTPVFNQYVVDNTNFNTIPSFGGVYSIEQYVTADAINIAPPVSSWYRSDLHLTHFGMIVLCLQEVM